MWLFHELCQLHERRCTRQVNPDGHTLAPVRCPDCSGSGSPGLIGGYRIICEGCGGDGWTVLPRAATRKVMMELMQWKEDE